MTTDLHRPLGSRHDALVCLFLLLALVLTTFAYWPSLEGGYLFDDYPNIVDNRTIHLRSLDYAELREAALSSPSTTLVRPLAMLSFGLDWYFGNGDPRRMRIVNLSIHLLNGLLLFGLLQTILRFAAKKSGEGSDHLKHSDFLALCISAAWLLAPINFTAVGYIVQRMESLCQVFVLGGLWAYTSARCRMLDGRSGFVAAVAALVLGTGIGALSKESGVLLPAFAFIVDWALFGFTRSEGKPDRRLHAMYFLILFLPAGLALVWATKHVLPATAWSNRSFTLTQRLLTEPRIIIDYIRWSLLPTPNALALYHDTIKPSSGLFAPPTSFLSLCCLGGLAISAALLKRVKPLLAIGLLWFLCAHLLTGTVIPLELTYEHRNYFASIGLYLTVFSALVPASTKSLYPTARIAACISVLVLFGTVTWIRALDWGNPISFAMSEAKKNPDSSRTAYELGRTYVILSHNNPNSPLIPKAYEALARAADLPDSGALADQGLIILAATLHQSFPDGTWTRLRNKLTSQPLSAENIGALYSLTTCAIEKKCNLPANEMIDTFAATIEHHPPDARVLAIYANYASNVLQDPDFAVALTRESIKVAPQDLQYRINLLLLLIENNRRDEAKTFYQQTLHDIPWAANDDVLKAWGALLQSAPKTIPLSRAQPL